MKRLVLSLSIIPALLVGLCFMAIRMGGQSYSTPSIPFVLPATPTFTSVTTGSQTTTGATSSATYATATTCTSSAGTCGSAAAGQVTIAAAATTVTVATTAVHTGSQIFLGVNSTLGTALGVTCNTTAAFGQLLVTTVTNNTSFVITISAAPTTNPECIQYFIEN